MEGVWLYVSPYPARPLSSGPAVKNKTRRGTEGYVCGSHLLHVHIIAGLTVGWVGRGDALHNDSDLNVRYGLVTTELDKAPIAT